MFFMGNVKTNLSLDYLLPIADVDGAGSNLVADDASHAEGAMAGWVGTVAAQKVGVEGTPGGLAHLH